MKYILGIVLVFFALMLANPMPGYTQSFSGINSNTDNLTNEEIDLLAAYQNSSIKYLYDTLLLYRKTTGVFPETMCEFVESGFPVFWPDNLFSNNSMYVIDSFPEFLNESDLGALTYSLDYDTALLGYINYDRIELNQNNDKVLVVSELTIPYTKDHKVYIDNSDTAMPSYGRPETLGEPEIWTFSDLDTQSISNGTMRVNEVDDYSTRVLYAFCGQITEFLGPEFRNYYFDKGEFAPTLADLLRHKGAGRQIIIENIRYFTELLQDADADFRCGFDPDTKIAYLYLEIDDVEYITYYEQYGNSPRDFKSRGVNVDDLDMSNPLISTENLSDIEIPYEYIISIRDIPAGI